MLFVHVGTKICYAALKWLKNVSTCVWPRTTRVSPRMPLCVNYSLCTHPVLWVFKHIGHTASVLLEATQQLSQANRQKPQSESVKGHSGEFHGSCYSNSSVQILKVFSLHISTFHSVSVLPRRRPRKLSFTATEPPKQELHANGSDWQAARPIGGETWETRPMGEQGASDTFYIRYFSTFLFC